MGLFDPVPGKNFWYRAGYWLSRTVARAFFSFEVQHAERIPKTGGVILAMNHQSFLDPPFAGICAQRPLFFLARKTLLNIPLLGPILPKVNVIPVDRGGADMSALKTVIRMIREGESTIVFPEGTRTSNGALQPAQAGLGMIIAKTMAPVVPMRVFGAFDAFPRTAKFPRMRPVKIVVGEPITFTEADFAGSSRDAYRLASERVMERIAALKMEAKPAPIVLGETRAERGWWLALAGLLIAALTWAAFSAAEHERDRGTLETVTERAP
jgi:1-acyl-sn-glycerol-3-phosphate acyltransferase